MSKRACKINTQNRKRVRSHMIALQGNRCCYCAHEFDDCNPWGDRYATIEHIEDRAKGGSNKQDNLAMACFVCNQRAGAEGWSPDFKRNRIRATNVIALGDLVVEHMELPPAYLKGRAA
jgi:5-methylcytosine-specific restriction endonuclease McrA